MLRTDEKFLGKRTARLSLNYHNASEVTTLWRYTNLFIIIIIVMW